MDRDIDERLIELHRLHFKKIVNMLIRKCGDVEMAKDIAQDAFETCVERKAELNNHPNLAGWLYVTAFNKLANEMKRARNRKEIIIMRLEKQLSYFEIAETRGITEDAARQQFSRAFRKCKNYFDDESQITSLEESASLICCRKKHRSSCLIIFRKSRSRSCWRNILSLIERERDAE